MNNYSIRLFSGPGCVLDDGPCNNCGQCHDEDEPVTLTAEDINAELGDIKRAAERDEAMYLSVPRENEGSV